MQIDVVADGLWAYRLGSASFAMIYVLAGATLLGVGIHRRRRFTRWNRSDDQRLLQAAPDTAVAGEHDEHDPRLRDDYEPDYDPADDADLWPRAPQPPGRGTVFMVLGVIVLVLGASHVVTAMIPRGAPTAMSRIEAGQCITADSFEQRRIDAEPVDCDRTDAVMELVSVGDGRASCPDGLRNGTDYVTLFTESRTQCFAFNLRENNCYTVDTTMAPTDCTDPAAKAKVLHRSDATSDSAACPAGTRIVVSYPQPTRLYCFTAP